MGLKQRPGRRSIRLPGYDYSQPGAYFVTLCARDRALLFGDVVNGEMRANDWGKIVEDAWTWLPQQYSHVSLDSFIVMPNHLHGILTIHGVQDSPARGGSRTAPTGAPTRPKPLGALIGAFKTVSTKRINLMAGTPGNRVWQRNYYEHVIRDKPELERIRRYVELNPMRWEVDRENPAAPRRRPPQTNARKT